MLFRVGDLDLPERRTSTSSWEEEDVAAPMYPRGTTRNIKIHIVRGCEIYKEKRGALEKGHEEIRGNYVT